MGLDIRMSLLHSSLAMVKGLVTAIGGNEFPLLQISYWVLWMRVDARCDVRSTLPMPSKHYNTTAVTTRD